MNTIIPSNEVINWQAGGVLTISMDYARQLSSVLIDLGDAEVADSKFKLEVTSDGTNWQAVDLKPVSYTHLKKKGTSIPSSRQIRYSASTRSKMSSVKVNDKMCIRDRCTVAARSELYG